MRVHLLACLIVLSAALVSCADMPTAPRAMVPASGTILDRNGKGIQAVYVYFEDLGPRAHGTDPAFYLFVTNIEGRYTGVIPEGRYDVGILPPARSAYAPLLMRSKTVSRAGVRLDHKFDYIRVAIHPEVAGGQSISALTATLRPSQYQYFFWQRDLRLAGDEREAFVPPGNYEIHMSLRGVGFGYPIQALDVTLGADTTLVVTFSGNAVGYHVTGQGGQAMDSARVWASGSGIYADALTDVGGDATVYLPNGNYTLGAEASTSEIMGRQFRNVSISGDASFNFDLSGTTWTGSVLRDGLPLAGVTVFATPMFNTDGVARSITNESGAFHVVVRTGEYYRVFVYELVGGDAYAEVARVDSVASGADSTLQIVAHPAIRTNPAIARMLAPTAGFATPIPPAGRDAPASAAAGPAFRRRSFRTAE